MRVFRAVIFEPVFPVDELISLFQFLGVYRHSAGKVFFASLGQTANLVGHEIHDFFFVGKLPQIFERNSALHSLVVGRRVGPDNNAFEADCFFNFRKLDVQIQLSADGDLSVKREANPVS